MNVTAIVVGVNAYERVPLTSAVNDAVAFRRSLIDLSLARPEEVTLLTSPLVSDASEPATYDAIRSRLMNLYFQGDDVERLIFYFAGHGMLAFSDPAMSQADTAILPVDVVDVEKDARNLIHLSELRGYMRLAGPQEQLYFIDACRDLPYKKLPAWSGLGWGPRDPSFPRRQATLYAVAELGKAVGIANQGLMTRRLIEALNGTGTAVDYDLERDSYVITMQSVRNYVRRKVAIDMGQDLISPALALPSLDKEDPAPSPIRRVTAPPQRPLTVHIEPSTASKVTTVRIGLGGSAVVQSWPPLRNHATVMLDPRPYRLAAEATIGIADPRSCLLDVRETDETTVRVTERRPRQPVTSIESGVPSGVEKVNRRRVWLDPPPIEEAVINVNARDEVIGIDVSGLEPPYSQYQGVGILSRSVAPGSYRVNFRFGPEQLSATEVYVAAGERVSVDAGMDEILSRRAPNGRLSGEEMQILALSLFDDDPSLGFFGTQLPRLRSEARELQHPIAIVVDSTFLTAEVNGVNVDLTPVGTAYGQAAVGLAEAGDNNSSSRVLRVGVTSAEGNLNLVSAHMPGRLTFVTLRQLPGFVDINQLLVPYPQRWRREYNDPLEVSRLVRGLQTLQQLFKSNELFSAVAINPGGAGIELLLNARWGDPIFGPMAIYANLGDIERGSVDNPLLRQIEHISRQNYRGHTSRQNDSLLPDFLISLSLLAPELRRDLLVPLLAENSNPLLAESTATLARFAIEEGQSDHPIVRHFARVARNQPWNLTTTSRD